MTEQLVRFDKRKWKPSKLMLIIPVSAFAVLFLAMGLGLQIPVGNLAGPQPLPVRVIYLVVGIVNVLAVPYALHSPAKPEPSEDVAITQQEDGVGKSH